MSRPVAVVTGGARGLGEAIGTRLYEDGYDLVVADILADLAEETAARIAKEADARVADGRAAASGEGRAATGGDGRAATDGDGRAAGSRGGRAVGVGIDVRDDASVAAAFARVREEFGRADVLVNNAGVVVRSASQDIDTENWMREVDINLGGTMRCSREVYPLLLESPNPSIVNLASVGSSLGLNLRLGYTATKTGVVGMTRELAAEWGRRGIRVNAVAPGYMDTTMTRTGLAAGVLDEQLLLQHTPLGRLGRADEVAAVVSFLVSPDASFVTGVMLPVDGGFIIDGTFHRLDE